MPLGRTRLASLRIARLRMEKRGEYVRETAARAVKIFIGEDSVRFKMNPGVFADYTRMQRRNRNMDYYRLTSMDLFWQVVQTSKPN